MNLTLKQGTALPVNDEVSLVLTADTTFDVPAIDEQHFAELVQISKLGASIVTEEAVAEAPVAAPAKTKKAPAKAAAKSKAPAKKK